MIYIEKETTMFTLPVDVEPMENFGTMSGKLSTARTWQIEIRLDPGYMGAEADSQWSPALHPYNEPIKITVSLGDVVLIDKIITEPYVYKDFIVDQDRPTTQNLSIRLSGKKENINRNVHPVIKIDLSIENTLVNSILEELGTFTSNNEVKYGVTYMGENGVQELEIYTPIYVWLLKNKTLLKQLSNIL